MTEEIDTYEKYWKRVQRTALISFNEVAEEAENNDEELHDGEHILDAAEYSMETGLSQKSPRTVINFTQEGFYGRGQDLYLRGQEFNGSDPRVMLYSLAHAAFYNDVRSVLENIVDYRNDLGECVGLIEGPIYDEGVEFEYDYEKSEYIEGDYVIETYTFTLRNVGAGCWTMEDPKGLVFENISPKIYVTEDDVEIPVRSLKILLDNICAKRLREIEDL